MAWLAVPVPMPTLDYSTVEQSAGYKKEHVLLSKAARVLCQAIQAPNEEYLVVCFKFLVKKACQANQ